MLIPPRKSIPNLGTKLLAAISSSAIPVVQKITDSFVP